MTRYTIAMALLMVTACGGPARTGTGPTAPGETRGVEAAALPYEILAARGGQAIDADDFYARLAEARAVCFGETHPNPHDHWAQLQAIREVGARHRDAGVPAALGMEMFQHPFQGVLDDFAAGRIAEAALLSRSGWAERWGYDFGLYRPLIAAALEHGMTLLALNTPRELTKKVSGQGLDALSDAERRELPELVLDDADHRGWWDDIMDAMGGAHAHGSGGAHANDEDDEEAAARAAARGERIYTAQVLWDETMAELAARWLAADDARRMIILAGNGHCHDSAIVRRLERRGVEGVVSVRPIIDDGEGNVAALLVAPIYDYLFVMSAPD
jgi:uncharacterized iron-regulated protein